MVLSHWLQASGCGRIIRLIVVAEVITDPSGKRDGNWRGDKSCLRSHFPGPKHQPSFISQFLFPVASWSSMADLRFDIGRNN